jgi:pimeloyl-ACP methyl ester carboxylesterase
MPYVNNQGVRIHYEVEGMGPHILLVHGLFDSLDAWYEAGYVDSLKKNYQLILMDIRGHGASDKPHNPEMYRFELLVADLIAVLDALNVRKAHFLGYSAGGRIGFGVAKYASSRFNSFILGGADASDMDQAFLDSYVQRVRKGMDAVCAWIKEDFGMRISPQMEARWATNDTEASAAFLTGSQMGRRLEDVLHTMTVPCLVYLGEGDDKDSSAKKWVGAMPNSTFVSFPGLDHIAAFLRSDLVLPHITKFLAKTT